jgi:hypothetical protein
MHNHYCSEGGHYWECLDSTCECICGVLMDEGDHEDCPVELRACPEHPEGNLGENAEAAPDAVAIDFSALSPDGQQAKSSCQCGCAELAPGASVGFCLWCDHRYADYSREIDARHFAEHCPGAPEGLKQAEREWLAKRKMMRPVFEGKA